MDVVDTQVHFGPGTIDETLARMDALGIRAVLIDENGLTRSDGAARRRLDWPAA